MHWKSIFNCLSLYESTRTIIANQTQKGTQNRSRTLRTQIEWTTQWTKSFWFEPLRTDKMDFHGKKPKSSQCLFLHLNFRYRHRSKPCIDIFCKKPTPECQQYYICDGRNQRLRNGIEQKRVQNYVHVDWRDVFHECFVHSKVIRSSLNTQKQSGRYSIVICVFVWRSFWDWGQLIFWRALPGLRIIRQRCDELRILEHVCQSVCI